MPEPPAGPFHAGLTPERIIDVALELTREAHLYIWSIRDLAGRLSVAPSVIYHHVGGKERLARHVAERVLGELDVPPSDLGWQEWFRTLLGNIHPIASAHPGVAKWVLLHGPTFPSTLPIVAAGVQVLQRGGFGDRVGMVYSTLLNNAVLTISLNDERLLHEDDGPRDHATMMEEFRLAAAGTPGTEALTDGFIAPFAQGGDTAARERAHYYAFVVETTIAGLESLLGTEETQEEA